MTGPEVHRAYLAAASAFVLGLDDNDAGLSFNSEQLMRAVETEIGVGEPMAADYRRNKLATITARLFLQTELETLQQRNDQANFEDACNAAAASGKF